MDHYFIFIYADSLTSEEKLQFNNYLNSSLPSEEEIQYTLDFAPYLSPILKRFSIRLANFNISSKQDFVTSWLEINGLITGKNNFFPSFSSTDDVQETFSLERNLSIKISNALHILADELPERGSYLLDIVISGDILKNADANHHLDLIGVLLRFYKWHYAVISIMCSSISQNKILQEWQDCIHAQFLCYNNISSSSIFWRGNLSFSHDEMPEDHSIGRLQLTLDSQKPKYWSILAKTLGVKNNHEFDYSHIQVSSEIEILDHCTLSTIPSYMISPINFTLSATDKNEKTSAFCLIQYLNSSYNNCFIVRLNYNKMTTSNEISELTFSNWKKAVLSGNISLPKLQLNEPSNYLIFAVSKHPSSSSLLTAYLLMPSSIMNKSFINTIILPYNSDNHFQSYTTIQECQLLFSKIPHCKENYNVFLKTLQKIYFEILLEWMERRKGKSELSIEEISYIFNNVKDILCSQLKFAESNDFKVNVEASNQMYDIDPSDWPERLHLLRKQIQNDKKEKNELQKGVMTPPEKAIIISAKDIGKYFNELGEANVPLTEILMPSRNITYFSEKEIEKHTPSKRFHDIYKNYNDNCEEEEAIRTKIRNHLVQHETASTCCNEQQGTDYTTILLPHGKSKRRKRKSTPTKYVPRPRSMSNISRKNLNKSTSDIVAPKRKRNVSVPLRRSPRKHKSKNEKQLSSNSNKQDDLTEKHKMKLREAVVLALEKHNIVLNHAMFKPCARKLFAVCKPFVKDITGKGSTSALMKQIAAAHAKQVVDFEMQKNNLK